MTISTNNDNNNGKKPSSPRHSTWVNERSIAQMHGENGSGGGDLTYPTDASLEERVISDLLSAGVLSDDSDLLMKKITPFLRHDDFFSIKLAAIYAAMVRIYARGDTIDVQSVMSDLSKRKALDLVGGEDYLTQLSLGIPNHTETHARDVVRLALFRATISSGHKMRTLGQQTELELGELAAEMSAMIRDIQARVSMMDERNVYNLADYQQQYLARMIDDATNPDFVPGIPIWLTGLNNALYGWMPDNLYVVGAGTGAGKSQLLINAALDVAKSGKNVVFISLELSINKVFDRILAMLTGIPGRAIKERKLSAADIAKLEALNNLPHNPLQYLKVVVMDNPTMVEMQAKLDEMFYRDGFEFACIDYLGVETVRHEGNKYPGSTEHAAQMWQTMRSIKATYGVPFLVATQVNRNYMKNTDKRPRLTDIANSSICEKAADVVMLFQRMSVVDSMGQINHGDITVAKNRDGDNGQLVDVWFDEANGQIDNWPDTEDAEDVL